MATNPMPFVTFEDYLALEEKAPYKSEYRGGQIVMMAGGSYDHGLIAGNLIAELRAASRKKGCRVTGSDVLVRTNPKGAVNYPDAMVVCGPIQFAEEKRLVVTNPLLIVEVLSPSTEGMDRGSKAVEYWKSSTLQVLLLISQDQPLVQVQIKLPDGSRLVTDVFGMDAAFRIEPLDCEIALRDIYDGVEFGAV